MAITFGSRPPKLLVVDDEPAILDLLQRRLEALGCTVSTLPGGTGVVQAARDQVPDLILLDVMMPDFDGFSVVQALKQEPEVRDIPVIMMTARSELESRIKGLELGAHDYVAKPFEAPELMARIRAALRVKQLQDELKDANKKLERLATSDPLTDLPNRRTFDEQFFLAVERARRTGEVLSVIMLDLDHFKQINDTYGHRVGDDALRQIGRLLTSRQRVTDVVGRYGGEEFVWVLPGAKTEDAMEIAEWLRRSIGEMSVETERGPARLAMSAGLTTYDPAEHGPMGSTTVLEAADQALRQAKDAGRNRVEVRALGVGKAVTVDAPGEEPAAEDETPGFTRYR